MRATINGWRLAPSVGDGVVHSGAKPTVKVASSPRPRTIWNGNPYCEPGTVLYYPGYPGTGNTIYDFSGQGNHGTITGAVWRRLSTGLSYLYFDGGDLVNCGAGTGLDVVWTVFTLRTWIRAADATPANYKGIMSKGAGGGNNNFSFTLETTGKIRLWFSAINLTYSTGTLSDNVFSSGAAVWTGTQNIVYLDAVAGTPVANTPVVGASGLDVLVGKFGAVVTSEYVGEIVLPHFLSNVSSNAFEILNSRNQERHFFGG